LTASQAFHRQGAFRPFPQRPGGLPSLAFSTPLHPPELRSVGLVHRALPSRDRGEPAARDAACRLLQPNTKHGHSARTIETSRRAPFSDARLPRRAASGGAPKNGWCLESTCPPRSGTGPSVCAMRTEAHSGPTRHPASPSRHSAKPGGNSEEDGPAEASFQPVARTIRPSALPGCLPPPGIAQERLSFPCDRRLRAFGALVAATVFFAGKLGEP
jgi:hypothetical protein